MRRFALVLLAGLLALGMSAGVGKLTAKPVFASDCNVSDSEGVIYSEHQTGLVYVQGSDGFHGVYTDLWNYRYGSGNQCYRAYYTSVWMGQHETMDSLTAHLRVWICGQPAADFQQVAYNTWGRAVVSYRQNVVWGTWPPNAIPSITLNVATPDGYVWALDFVDYTPCGPQADNYITSAVNQNYNPSVAAQYLNVG